MSFALGLTGSIGMGKSTTAQMFVDEGCALWDADAAVHRLYSKGGAAVDPMHAAFPTAIVDGAVSREALKQIIGNDPAALKQIEGIVHPLVAADRASFRANATADILVFDIPLLFETGGDAAMDAIACVSIPADEQKRRVMARGTMTEAQFEQIRAKQMPNEEKCARSDYVIETDSLDHARAQVQDVVRRIRAGLADA
ncbi:MULTISPECIES: dephospho-CoA kinase [unclassified Ruegeria]|uniref:dephospho-CoA kinase n=1 Tax=unclassified Ruegeria TaxID=2625375 RepID=UPI001ADA8A31|nr:MULTISPECIES: dephospho-CoA kinase [unclassified Ruegeria]MBO9412220.1 dephospho-CoA kinase [Ruegeria sp. R8_1]MBO9417474.1 dephospho-CoA kinase [Ruegeria sp. R8_2]